MLFGVQTINNSMNEDKDFSKEDTVVNKNFTLSDVHWNGEQQLNKSTGAVEVWYNVGWCAK